MQTRSTIFSLGLGIMIAILSGCGAEPGTNTSSGGKAETEAVDAHAGHAHPTEGPHHGDLVELGNEEYHAEVVHDEDAGTITIYVLDGAVSKQVPIEATEITINVKHDGQPEQHKLAAVPDATDPSGKSSRFVSNNTELAEHLDEEGAEARLVLTIDGKSFRGVIAHNHDHDHDEHDDHPEHDDHDGHDHDEH